LPRLFISYRRSDTAGHVGWLNDRIAEHFGQEQIFRDIETIRPGADFVTTIQDAVGSCDVLLAMIGKQWLSSADAEGRRRLDDPGDFVRLEVATALEREILVIPVLVQGATMPQAEELPEPLKALARRNALELTDARWAFDVGRLIETIERSLGEQSDEAPPAEIPSNLPVQPTPFVGRAREVARACELLLRDDTRLLTLTGPGGIGKTRLSIECASRVLPHFPDGVWFVAVAEVRTTEQVVATMAHTLDVSESGGDPLQECLQDFLRDRRALLVVDNFEQVMEAADLVASLLENAPQVKVLVTSRAVLRIYGEQEYPVPPLDLPPRQQQIPLERLAEYAAIDLFLRRARTVKPDLRLTEANAQAVIGCCHQLDGLPLAIELAAARIRLMPPQQILARLEQRLKLLTGGARNLPSRQQTLRGAIDWSYELLDSGEQELFARLAVFAGGCTFEAVEAVCNAEGDLEVDVLDGLDSLVSKSLVRQREPEGDDEYAEPRFEMLGTIREYARERLDGRGETDQMNRQHAAWYLQFAESGEHDGSGAPQSDALEREHDNLRAALQWALDKREVETALRLASSLWGFWYTRCHLSEGRRWLEAVLKLAPAQSPDQDSALLRAKALHGAGVLAVEQGDYASAESFFSQSLGVYREHDVEPEVASSLSALGTIALLGGDFARARELYEESLELKRKVADTSSVADLVSNLGMLAYEQGDYTAARGLYEESLDIRRQSGDQHGIGISLINLGQAVHAQGDLEAAQTTFCESLELWKTLEGKLGIAYALEGLAAVAGAPGATVERARHAALLWGAAESVRNEIDARLSPGDRARYEQAVATARGAVPAAEFDAAWAKGRAMPLNEVIEHALA
jgi:predicted ATPase